MERSIYELICENIKDGALKEGFSLPDEADSAPVKFAPGAFDGITIFHMGLDELDEEGLDKGINAPQSGTHDKQQEAFQDQPENLPAFFVFILLHPFLIFLTGIALRSLCIRDGGFPRGIRHGTSCPAPPPGRRC